MTNMRSYMAILITKVLSSFNAKISYNNLWLTDANESFKKTVQFVQV